MKRGWGLGEKHRDDPIGSDAPRGKNLEQRKHSRDGNTLTPTEQHIKNGLMRQFMVNPEGGGVGNSGAYRSSPVWCDCGRRMKAEGQQKCELCLRPANSEKSPTAVAMPRFDACLKLLAKHWSELKGLSK